MGSACVSANVVEASGHPSVSDSPIAPATFLSSGTGKRASWDKLFEQVDQDKDGKISHEELKNAMQNESAMLLSRNGKLRELVEEMENNQKKALSLEDFSAAMEDLFEMHYFQYYQSVNIEKLLTGFTMRHLVGSDSCEPILSEECLHMHPFQSLKSRPRQQRVDIVRRILRSMENDLAETIADGFVSAAEYAVQQEGVQGKFGAMLLAQVPLFDLGLEGMLGFADLKFQQAVEREHSSDTRFKAWNNDIERETSPSEQWAMVLPAGWGEPINNCDYRGAHMCDDFEKHPMKVAAGLEKVELVVLRLYTGPMYVIYNGLLRSYLKEITRRLDPAKAAMDEDELRSAVEEAKRVLGREYATTILVLASALHKLRRVSRLPQSRKVYRGMAGREVPSCFKREDAQGNRGGVEFGFLSTSTSKQQALGYINFSKGMPQLYEMEVGQVDRGADVSWISYFPAEAEVLLPPLSSLEALGDARYEDVEVTVQGQGGKDEVRVVKVMVWRMRLNVNLKAKTLAEMRGVRRSLQRQMADNAQGEVELVLSANNNNSHSSSEQHRVAEAMRLQCGEVVTAHKARGDDEFNDDAAYSRSVQELLELKPLTAALLRISASFPASVGSLLDSRGLADVVRSSERVRGGGAVASATLGMCRERGLVKDHTEEVDGKGLTPLVRCVTKGQREEAELLLLCGARADAVDKTKGKSALRLAIEGKKPQLASMLVEWGARDLHSAALLDDGEMVQRCVDLQGGSELDAVDKSGFTPLFSAVDKNHLQALRALVEAGAAVNVRCGSGGYAQKTPLAVAVEQDHAEAILILVEGGADLSVGSGTDDVLAVSLAAEKNKLRALRALVDCNADLNAPDHSGRTPVYHAALKGNREAVALLREGGAETTMHAAALLGDHEMVRECLERGAEPDQKLQGDAAVHLAVQKRSVSVLQALVGVRADLSSAGSHGKTPLRLAAEVGDTQTARVLVEGGAAEELYSAALLDDAEMVQRCVEDGAELDAVDTVARKTAAHSAAANNSVHALHALVDLKASVGVTELFAALLRGHFEVSSLLVEAGMDLNQTDGLGRNAVHWWAEGGHSNVVSLLEGAVVDWGAKDNRGWTGLDVAYYNKKEEAARVLEAKEVVARFKQRPAVWL